MGKIRRGIYWGTTSDRGVKQIRRFSLTGTPLLLRRYAAGVLGVKKGCPKWAPLWYE